jgi:DNA polymerase-3 subunit alpha
MMNIYLGRIETEFDVLRKLKVLDYFVIVGDMVRWAKDNGIRVGPGGVLPLALLSTILFESQPLIQLDMDSYSKGS